MMKCLQRLSLILAAAMLVPMSGAIAQADNATNAAEVDNAADTPANTTVPTPPEPKKTTVNDSDIKVGQLAELLFAVFALAVVLETALASIFNWPVFLARFNRRNLKMPLAFVLGTLIASGLKIDLVARTATAMGSGPSDLPPWLGYTISGLIFAGGSAGVRNMMVSLGILQPTPPAERAPAPEAGKAWISVTARRKDPKTALTILLSWTDAKGIAVGPQIIGSIRAGKNPLRGLVQLFLTDEARFPLVAGYPVEPGRKYTITVRNADDLTVLKNWADREFASGAIVDFVYSD